MTGWRRGVAVAAALVVALAQGSDRLAAEEETSSPEALLAKADAIAAEVAKVRGLAIKRPISRGVMTKEQIRARLLQRIAQEYSDRDLAGEELAMKRFGLLPAEADYKQLVVDLLTDQIAGFYDPWERQLYIAGWQNTGLQGLGEDMILAHEIDHALQDQHFNLKRLLKVDKRNGDAMAARQALVEGDGTALMVEFVAAKAGVSPWVNDAVLAMIKPSMEHALGQGALAAAPLALREALLFPYFGGLQFVVHFRKHHPWDRIDRIFRKPPLSTEHIAHPKKYEAYERPDLVAARPVPSLRGYSQRHDNIWGELGATIFLRQHGLARERAELAAEGWGGDRIAVYSPPEHTGGLEGVVGIYYAVWDAAADAVEFFEAIKDAMAALSGGKETATGERFVEYTDAKGGRFAAERRSDAVVVILGAPTAQAGELRGQVWQRWRVQRK